MAFFYRRIANSPLGGRKKGKMEEDHKEEIEKIIDSLKCSRGFQCYRSGFKSLCKAKDVGLESFLLCLEDAPQECRFSRPFGEAFFCKCPLRIYIAKELRK